MACGDAQTKVFQCMMYSGSVERQGCMHVFSFIIVI